MTSRNLPKHLETIINEACWGVPGVGQLTGEAKLRAILEAANNLSAVMPDPAKLPESGVPDAAAKEIGLLARQLGEAEAQRDELAALLREVQRWLKRGGSSTVAGRIDATLAKLDTPSCERCAGKGEVVRPEGGGVRTRWMAPCPDCQPEGESR